VTPGTRENPLAIAFDAPNLRARVPLIVIYGNPGLGKSTEAAKALSSALWITSEESVLRAYASWYALNPEEARSKGMINPDIEYEQGGMARKTIPEHQADGVTPFDTWGTINTVINRYLASVASGQCPFGGLVIDEFTALSGRVYGDMMRICLDRSNPMFKTKTGNPDRFGPPRAIIEWCGWICSIPRKKPGVDATKPLALVCHPEDPVAEDDLKGGPKLPTKKSRRLVCAKADAILRVYSEKISAAANGGDDVLGFEDKPDELELKSPEPLVEEGEYVSDAGIVRRFQTEEDQNWEAKFRDFAVQPRMKLDLREMLTGVGFAF